MEAKAGDIITPKAERALAKAMGLTHTELELAPDHKVEPKTGGNAGQWFCIDCGELPQNNWAASSHAGDKPKHRLAWRSFTSGKIEAP